MEYTLMITSLSLSLCLCLLFQLIIIIIHYKLVESLVTEKGLSFYEMVAEKKPKSLSKSCILIIVIGGMERFAFKGVACNLVTYLTDVVKMSNSSAAKIVNTWCGITYLLPLFVAPLADHFWDQYSTILASCSIYVLGLAALTWAALAKAWTSSSTSTTSSALFWSLSLISLGQGGYNPSLQAFGADQLENDEDRLPCNKNDSNKDGKSSNKKGPFFQWWYFGISTGSLLGVSLMSYIQDTLGWGLGFAIPMAAMIASIAVFSSRSRHYMYKKTKDATNNKPLKNLIRALRETISKMMHGEITLPSNELDVVEQELQEKPLCQKVTDEDDSVAGLYQFENAKVILRLLPIWTMLLMFAVIFNLPTTFFIKQGAAMKRDIGISDFKIPPATLQTAITVSIILLMPLYNTVLVPIVRTITCSSTVSVRQRMGAGMLLSIVAMAIAAIVEAKRREIGHENMSIFWLLPQYVLLGVSDVFTVVGMQEFFYGEVPETMRTMGIALYTSVFGVGGFLSAALISTVEFFTRSGSDDGGHGWFSDDMSEARLDKYYWLLAIGSTVSLVLFMILCRFDRTAKV